MKTIVLSCPVSDVAGGGCVGKERQTDVRMSARGSQLCVRNGVHWSVRPWWTGDVLKYPPAIFPGMRGECWRYHKRSRPHQRLKATRTFDGITPASSFVWRWVAAVLV